MTSDEIRLVATELDYISNNQKRLEDKIRDIASNTARKIFGGRGDYYFDRIEGYFCYCYGPYQATDTVSFPIRCLWNDSAIEYFIEQLKNNKKEKRN